MTIVNEKGEIKPGAAVSWEISDDGKKYIFTLKNNLKLSNGNFFEAKDVPYSFKDVKKEVLGKDKIQFTLKDSYAPFLSVVSKPILVKNYGFSVFHIARVDENSGFIRSLSLISQDNKTKKIIFFYPTQDALLTAFKLGEISSVRQATLKEDARTFSGWKNVEVKKGASYSQLVTVFFNSLDKNLSNKKVRQALSYSMPKDFPEGERTFSFIPPGSIYYTKSPNEGILDLDLAKSLLSASGAENLKITIHTPEELLPVAERIADSWKKLGVETIIKTTNDIPASYQAFLYDMKLPLDPDMYTIWHSGQINNIMHYKNVRIDKLLEDGRQSTDTANRIQIYSDVQKYLLDDAPATFLYFPYSYTIIRK